MDRLFKFNSAAIIQSLLIKLYGSLDKYINPDRISPLEEYLFLFDENCDHMGIVISIGERIGLMLRLKADFETSVDFYFKILDVINNKSNDSMIFYIMNMNQEQFGKYLIIIGKSEYQDEYIYLDRLYLYAHDFNIELLNKYLELK